MTNPFADQKQFMEAADQTVSNLANPQQAELYMNLIEEEFDEIQAADSIENLVKELADLLVVTIGALYSLGVEPDKVWQEVHRSNMSKLVFGKLLKREDGKVLKPDSYSPADMTPFTAQVNWELVDSVRLKMDAEANANIH